METRFESEKKLREIELLNKERLIRQTEIERKTSEAKHFQFQRNTIIAGMLFALALVIVVFKSYNDKKKANDVLHYQKEQIEEKNKELFAANAETELQKKVLEEKNKDILDSIRYAKRIQQAILPSSQKISDLLPQSFVLYKPKDIISGDFYWIYCNSVGNAQSSNTGEKIFLAAADCTGHGVPGAMVSLMGYNGLNKAVIEQKINQPSKILDSLSHSVIQGFRQEGKAEIKDGMDLALVSISRNPDSKLPNEEEMGYLLSFSGANNPIYIIRKKGLKGLRINNKQALHSAENNDFVLYEIPGNRQAIGASEAHEPFTNNEIIVRNTDCIYLFTDGYIDQFGGEKGKKFKSSNFKKLLLSVCNEPIDKQKNTISDTIEQWKGHYEQVDDMCVIGIRV
jgi:serine phosphatase RsbU (regulator of sigma subunit)